MAMLHYNYNLIHHIPIQAFGYYYNIPGDVDNNIFQIVQTRLELPGVVQETIFQVICRFWRCRHSMDGIL